MPENKSSSSGYNTGSSSSPSVSTIFSKSASPLFGPLKEPNMIRTEETKTDTVPSNKDNSTKVLTTKKSFNKNTVPSCCPQNLSSLGGAALKTPDLQVINRNSFSGGGVMVISSVPSGIPQRDHNASNTSSGSHHGQNKFSASNQSSYFNNSIVGKGHHQMTHISSKYPVGNCSGMPDLTKPPPGHNFMLNTYTSPPPVSHRPGYLPLQPPPSVSSVSLGYISQNSQNPGTLHHGTNRTQFGTVNKANRTMESRGPRRYSGRNNHIARGTNISDAITQGQHPRASMSVNSRSSYQQQSEHPFSQTPSRHNFNSQVLSSSSACLRVSRDGHHSTHLRYMGKASSTHGWQPYSGSLPHNSVINH